MSTPNIGGALVQGVLDGVPTLDEGFVTYSDRIFQICINNGSHARQLDKSVETTMMKSIKQAECLVSIILPVQGPAAELDRTIEGVLAQSQARWTMWLVESSDARGEAARWAGRDERIRVMSHDGTGRGAALLAGLAKCRSPYTVFLDAEHRWAPNFLALTTGFLAANPLMDVVCMQTAAAAGNAHMDTAEKRPSVYREKAPLRTMIDPDGGLIRSADLEGFDWHGGDLAEHLRWGEYTRMAVTLMTTDAASTLAPALVQDGAALDFRLQASLAQAFSVNLLGCTGAVRSPAPVSEAAALRHEIDALAVFDDVFGRRYEVDADIDRLRCERLALIRHLSGGRDRGRGPLSRLRDWVTTLRSVEVAVPKPRCRIDTVTGQLAR